MFNGRVLRMTRETWEQTLAPLWRQISVVASESKNRKNRPKVGSHVLLSDEVRPVRRAAPFRYFQIACHPAPLAPQNEPE